MADKGSLHEQVSANLLKMEAMPHFAAERVWLTFYLCGPPERLKLVADALAADDWQNTAGWEGAFLYPKVQVERTASAIVQVARSVQALSDRHAVDVLHIDADTSQDVRQSQFITVYVTES
jgi:hypothetical protein